MSGGNHRSSCHQKLDIQSTQDWTPETVSDTHTCEDEWLGDWQSVLVQKGKLLDGWSKMFLGHKTNSWLYTVVHISSHPSSDTEDDLPFSSHRLAAENTTHE